MNLTPEESRRVLSAVMESLSTRPSALKRLARETGWSQEDVIDALAGRIEELPASADEQALDLLTKVLRRLLTVDTGLRAYAALVPQRTHATVFELVRELRAETERLWRVHQRAIIVRLGADESEEVNS